MPNIQVVRDNSLGINRGIYADWMGNALSDANANTLLSEGAAVTVNYREPSINDALNATQQANSNIKGVAGVGNGKIYDENGDEVEVSNTQAPSAKTGKYVAATKKIMNCTNILPIVTDRASNPAQRVSFAGKNMKSIVIRNLVTNTVTFELGSTTANNIDNNHNFTPSYTVTPGNERVITEDGRQWFIRQAQTGVTANQFAEVEEIFTL